MMKKFLAGLQITVIAAVLLAGCSMFGDMEYLREKAKEANTPTPVNVPVIKITENPNSVNVAIGYSSGSTLIVAATVDPAADLSYQWYSNTTNTNSGGTPIDGETGTSYTIPTGLTEGYHYYFCEVRATGGAISVRTSVAAFKVEAEGVPVITIPTEGQPKSVTVYQGTISGSLLVAAMVDPYTELSYQWYSNTEPRPDGGSPVSGATNASFTIPTNLKNVGSPYYYFCEVRGGDGATPIRSYVATVAVMPAKTVSVGTMQNGPLYAGSSKSVSFSVTTTSITNGTSGSIQWYSNSGGTETTTAPAWITTTTVSNVTGNAATVNISVTSSIVISPVYYFRVLFEDAPVIQSNVITLTVSIPVIHISGEPADTPISVGNPANRSLTVMANIDGSGSISYQWYDNGANNSNTGGSSISSATNASFLIPKTLTDGTYYYYCVLISTTGGAVSVTTRAAKVTVVDGLGTVEEPFLVKNEADLRKVGTETGDGNWTLSAHYKQTADIPGSGKLVQGNWTPIGNVNYHFTGSYNGDGYAISGLTIDVNTAYQGMFGWIGSSGVVKNLTLTNADINVTYLPQTRVGAVVGYNEGEVKGCTVSGDITGDVFVGGVAGQNLGKVTDCEFSGSVIGTSNTSGGIAGQNAGTINNCHVTGDLEGYSCVGGIAGQNSGGSSIVKNCSFSGSITGTSTGSGWEYGGIVGSNSYSLVENCHVSGSGTKIIGFSQTGGVVGSNYQDATISACSFTGNTVKTTNFLSGGIAGHNMGLVERCFASGNVEGSGQTGGVAGDNTTSGTIQDCYSTAKVTGWSNTSCFGGIVGYNYSTVIRCYATGEIEDTGYGNVGGIVGDNGSDIATGTVSSCVALNPSIKGKLNAGRIIGINRLGDLANNYANSAMIINDSTVSGGTSSNNNGVGISSTQWNSSTWWSGTAGFGAAWSLANTWTHPTLGALPKLAWEP